MLAFPPPLMPYIPVIFSLNAYNVSAINIAAVCVSRQWQQQDSNFEIEKLVG